MHGLPVAYEVSVTLGDPADARRFAAWMQDHHIPEVLASGCFLEAELSERAPGAFRTRYLAPSRAALDRYVADFAPALRIDFEREFGGRASVSREMWEVLHHSQFGTGS